MVVCVVLYLIGFFKYSSYAVIFAYVSLAFPLLVTTQTG